MSQKTDTLIFLTWESFQESLFVQTGDVDGLNNLRKKLKRLVIHQRNNEGFLGTNYWVHLLYNLKQLQVTVKKLC